MYHTKLPNLIIKLWMGSVYARNLQQVRKFCTDKLFFAVHVQRFILIETIIYNNLHMQYLLKVMDYRPN